MTIVWGRLAVPELQCSAQGRGDKESTVAEIAQLFSSHMQPQPDRAGEGALGCGSGSVLVYPGPGTSKARGVLLSAAWAGGTARGGRRTAPPSVRRPAVRGTPRGGVLRGRAPPA
eukprot:scaffold699_cov385-Prasinococcus_capsulatus_cf.AAC.14